LASESRPWQPSGRSIAEGLLPLKLHCIFHDFASVAFLATMGSAIAADEWFVLGEQTIKSTDPSAAIKSAGGDGKRTSSR
jgi:hypothetical protein